MRDDSGDEMVQLLDVISTNVTSFFRENEHFEFVTTIMKRWLDAGQRRFRFWSAASSTGEEPYSFAMTLMEAAAGQSVDMKILATDISTRVLASASAGVYGQEKLKTVPPALRQRYFESHQAAEGPAFKVKDSLRRLIAFKRLNLSTPAVSDERGRWTSSFCCNVMIYFDNEVRRRSAGGYLPAAEAGRIPDRGPCGKSDRDGQPVSDVPAVDLRQVRPAFSAGI